MVVSFDKNLITHRAGSRPRCGPEFWLCRPKNFWTSKMRWKDKQEIETKKCAANENGKPNMRMMKKNEWMNDPPSLSLSLATPLPLCPISLRLSPMSLYLFSIFYLFLLSVYLPLSVSRCLPHAFYIISSWNNVISIQMNPSTFPSQLFKKN
jgi:hypothetical protein